MIKHLLKSICNKHTLLPALSSTIFPIRLLSSNNTKFSFKLNKFNDIHIQKNDIINFYKEINGSLDAFEATLKSFFIKFRYISYLKSDNKLNVKSNRIEDSLKQWESEKRTAVWIYLPMHLSSLAEVSAKYGFKYHHAENDQAVLYKWLLTEKESKIPIFATHQMGVAGVVYRPDTDQVLAIKERVMIKDAWKFPGGAANLSEDIADTAVREVYEETGIKSKFCSVIGFRQQHNYPNGHGRSDLYVVCRLEPLNYEINFCKDEIKDCQWIGLDKMCTFTENNLTQLVSKIIKHGKENGFDSIDFKPKHMQSIFPGRVYNFFHRNIDS